MRRIWGLSSVLIAMLACDGADPDSASDGMRVGLSIGEEGLRRVWVQGAGPLSSDPVGRLTTHGNVAIQGFDPSTNILLSEGRLEVSRIVHEEAFVDGQPSDGDIYVLEEASAVFTTPMTSDGKVGLTIAVDGGDERSFELDLSERGAVVRETEIVRPSAGALSSGVGAAREALTSRGVERWVDVERCGDGVLDPGGIRGFARITWPEQCDDGNRVDGDGCDRLCRHELVHLAGAEDAEGTVRIVFIPAGWSSVEEFEEHVRSISLENEATSFFQDYTDRFSYWALAVEEVSSLGDVECRHFDAQNRIDALEADLFFNRFGESDFYGAGTTYVLAHARTCAWSTANFGANVRLSSDHLGQVLGHELGHALGHLADEYPYGRRIRTCQADWDDVANPNISTRGDVKWLCMTGQADEGGMTRARRFPSRYCADGRPVGAYTLGGVCEDDVVVPCPVCRMSDSDHAFCPVCYETLEMRVLGLLGEPARDELADGIDNDLDGDVDEGESCDCEPDCDGQSCGDDGCGDSCGTCGAGEVCRITVGDSSRFTGLPAIVAATCEAGCGDRSCRDSLGREICEGETGVVSCGGGGSTPCMTDGDCSSGRMCVRDRCVPITTCTCRRGSFTDCDVCSDGSCRSGCQDGLTGETICPGDTLDDVCTTSPWSCTDDSDCDRGQQCHRQRDRMACMTVYQATCEENLGLFNHTRSDAANLRCVEDGTACSHGRGCVDWISGVGACRGFARQVACAGPLRSCASAADCGPDEECSPEMSAGGAAVCVKRVTMTCTESGFAMDDASRAICEDWVRRVEALL